MDLQDQEKNPFMLTKKVEVLVTDVYIRKRLINLAATSSYTPSSKVLLLKVQYTNFCFPIFLDSIFVKSFLFAIRIWII